MENDHERLVCPYDPYGKNYHPALIEKHIERTSTSSIVGPKLKIAMDDLIGTERRTDGPVPEK